MDKKKHKLTQGQINGIIWIAMLLLVILAIKLFSSERVEPVAGSDSVRPREEAFLEKLEDSVYRSRSAVQGERRRPQEARKAERKAPVSERQSWYSSEPPVPTRRALTVELNSADTTTLQLLHGVGPAFARRIVRYRERLGGFVSTEQLLEVYGFTPELLAHIAPHLTLDSTHRNRIAVNSVPLKQFIKHPYVDYYFARDLVNLRSRGMIFSTPDDLRTLPSCTDTLLAKLLPYLDFSAPKE